MLLHELAQPQQIDNAAQIYVCVTAPEVLGGAMKVAQRLRQAMPGIGVRVHMGGGQLKKQFKRADASGATGRYFTVRKPQRTNWLSSIYAMPISVSGSCRWSRPLPNFAKGD